MEIFEKIAEERIKEAIERGEFDNLPGKGKPFRFDDEEWVPGDQRLAFKILRNAGCIPPELELKKEITSLMDLIKTIDDEKEKLKRINELNFKLLRFNLAIKRPINIEGFPEYEKRLYEKVLNK